MSIYEHRLIADESIEYVEDVLRSPVDELLSFPKYIMIETLNWCNARCIMCGIDFTKKKYSKISEDLFNKIADEIALHKDHVEKVMLYLDCDPVLDKTLPEKITFMKKIGVKVVNISTNASPLNEKKGEAIIKAGLDEMYISMESMNKEIYESIRVGLKFEKVYRNICNFIKLRDKLNPKLKVRIQFIQQKENQNEADEFVEHWKTLTQATDDVIVTKGHNWGSGINMMEFGDENNINNIPCIGLWGTFCIHVDGEIGLCSVDPQIKVPVGNISDKSIVDVWQGEGFEKVRKIHSAGKREEIKMCDGCTLWREKKKTSVN